MPLSTEQIKAATMKVNGRSIMDDEPPAESAKPLLACKQSYFTPKVETLDSKKEEVVILQFSSKSI